MSFSTVSARPALYIPPNKRTRSSLPYRAPSTFVTPPTPILQIKKTPLTRVLSSCSLSDSDEEAELITALRADPDEQFAPTPTWMIPLLDRVELRSHSRTSPITRPSPVSSRPSLSQLSTCSSTSPISEPYSRPSSRLSTISSACSDASFSAFSTASLSTAASSLAPSPVSPMKGRGAEEEDVFVDLSKKEITPYLYEGGKTTVLTGGVMLGGRASASSASTVPTPAQKRRSALLAALQPRIKLAHARA